MIDNLLKKNDVELDQLYAKFDDVQYKNRAVERKTADLKQTNEYILVNQLINMLKNWWA